MKYVAITVIGIIALWLLFYFSIFAPIINQDKTVSVTSSLELSVPPGMWPYKSPIFRFFFFYPDDLKIKEYAGGSDTTITFDNAKTGRGFQIFIVPYAEDHITPEQFKKDLPSGVMENPVEILIDGTKAMMFYSKNAAMGDMREVWFIKNSFLYEVTTYRELDSWLSSIMQTWQFLEI
ncbi:MAG: hypothetical protein Q7S73_01855 [bacterium]|nr:hypothetical protein [bacterium]